VLTTFALKIAAVLAQVPGHRGEPIHVLPKSTDSKGIGSSQEGSKPVAVLAHRVTGAEIDDTPATAAFE
jgi:hypothetical protein